VTGLRYLDAAAVGSALPPAAALAAIRDALLGGLDPVADLPRTSVPLRNGEYLLMPSEAGGAAGIKVLTVAPGNAARGLPRIQGLYLLADGATLTPRALLDGAALTLVRTPAVSFAAVADALRRATEPLGAVVFGAGPQAQAHVEALRGVLDGVREIREVTTVVRRSHQVGPAAVLSGSADADVALRRAGLVICATTARAPLFDSAGLRDDAVVVAVGSHEPDARELDASLMGRANVVVEDVGTALREAGDVVLAVRDGVLDPVKLLPMRDVVRGEVDLAADRPLVFKSTGMSWEDLVIAEAVVERVAPLG
jgi:ornithine cyclodeaminase/alanine dehydrogenase-like protein (mu-crystallin family)